MKKGKAVYLGVDGQIQVVDVPNNATLDYFYKGIGCDFVEIVRPVRLANGYVLIIDEEGLMKRPATVNVVASALYDTPNHGSPIVGNAYLVKEAITPDGADLESLDATEAREFRNTFKKNFVAWYKDVAIALELAEIFK